MPVVSDDLTRMSGEPLEHIAREHPPWRRRPPLTVCGRPLADVKAVTTPDDINAKIRRVGKSRAAMTTCMTCVERHNTTSPWARNPAYAVAQDVEKARYGRDAGPDARALRRELLAIGMLVEEHPDEYESYLSALEHTTDLDSARRRARLRSVQ